MRLVWRFGFWFVWLSWIGVLWGCWFLLALWFLVIFQVCGGSHHLRCFLLDWVLLIEQLGWLCWIGVVGGYLLAEVGFGGLSRVE